MKKILTAITVMMGIVAMAQDSTKEESRSPLISGSIDTYYRYNFANPPTGVTNNFTSFTNSQNSFELGLATIRADHSFGKASATIDLGFGRRAQENSYNDGVSNSFFSLANIKQLYISYSPTDKIKLTAGKWDTHIGYEVTDAYLNRNYSMSYMFSYGPFFHTGIKADVSFGGKTAAMIGIANPTDYSTTMRSAKFVIAQLSSATSNEKLKAYLNYQGGRFAPGISLHQFDLVLNGTITGKFGIGYNGTMQFRKPVNGSSANWWGSALYFNFDPSSYYGLTLRAEYFDDEDAVAGLNNKVLSFTLSNIFKVGNLGFIPELRYESASKNLFIKHNGDPAKILFPEYWQQLTISEK